MSCEGFGRPWYRLGEGLRIATALASYRIRKTRSTGVGEDWPSPLHVGSPGQRLSTGMRVRALCRCISCTCMHGHCNNVGPSCLVLVWVFFWNSARAGEALGHLVLRFYAFVASCLASVSGAVPGTGGTTGSFGVPVPTASPQNNGAAHGPRHPAYTASILPNQLFWLCRVFVGLLVSLRFLFGIPGRKTQLVCILALQVPVPVRWFA